MQQPDQLSTTFAALADPTRRAILARLAQGEASVKDLSAPFEMSQPAISKHLRVLERAGLIEQGRQAQWRPRRLRAGPAARDRRLGRASTAGIGRRASNGWMPTSARCRTKQQEQEMETTMTATRIDRGSTDTTTIYSEGGDLVFERTFDAPRERVWKAFMDPEIVPRWWGPHGTTTTVDEMDVRPGGKWRYVSQRARSRGRRLLRRVPGDRPARALPLDVHVRRRGRRPAGRPRDPHVRGCRRPDEGHVRRAHGIARGRSRAPWRPAWSRAPSRPGIAWRPARRGLTHDTAREPGTATVGARFLMPVLMLVSREQGIRDQAFASAGAAA